MLKLALNVIVLVSFVSPASMQCLAPETMAQSKEAMMHTVSLGEACTAALDCSAAFSACSAGTCECINGTKRVHDVCVPEARRCPVGNPLVDANLQLVVCNPNPYNIPSLSYAPKSPSLGEDTVEAPGNGTCPHDHVCISEGEVSYGAVRGFCCPVPDVCPIGLPDKNKTCDHADGSGLEHCPHGSHYCHISVTGVTSGQICCPKPCPGGSIYKDGFCGRQAKLGGPCHVHSHLQCAQISAECIEGTCQCPEDMVFSARFENCRRPTCDYTNETLYPLRDPKGNYLICPEAKCPENAYCSDGDNVCCPKPARVCGSTDREDSDVPQSCVAYADEEACPAGKFCKRLYSEIRPDAASFEESGSGVAINHGICCDR